MCRSLITILLVFAFVAPAVASVDLCRMAAPQSTDEMACCQQAQAVTGAVAARLCCELFCGEPLDQGVETAASITLPTSLLAPVSSVPSASILVFRATDQVKLVLHTVKSSLQQQRSLPLFLSHSAFLI